MGTGLRRSIVDALEARLRGRVPLQVVLGPRQVGKTTAVHQVAAGWHGPGHYASADLPAPPSAEWIEAQWETARVMAAAAKKTTLLILDEVQKVPRWADVAKAQYDRDRAERIRVKTILLGSSALQVTTAAQESLAGRFERHYLPHWSFAECEKVFGFTLDEWLFFGGYPAANAMRRQPARWADFVATSLVEAVLGRDVLQLARVSRPALLRQLYMMATRVPAQILSFNKMLGQLQDAGNTVTLAGYLELLGSAFLLSGLNQYSGGALRARASSPKLVFWSNALINSVAGLSFAEAKRDTAWWGRLVENAVGGHLLNQLPPGGRVSWWREGDLEVDYVIEIGPRVLALEVKSGRARRPGGLRAFKDRVQHARALEVGAGGMQLETFFRTPLALLLRSVLRRD
jgi:predicted AAA+ superfamily ATPase